MGRFAHLIEDKPKIGDVQGVQAKGRFAHLIEDVPREPLPESSQPPPIQEIQTGDPGAPLIRAQQPDKPLINQISDSLVRNTRNIVAKVAGSVHHLSTLADKPALNWIGKHAGRLEELADWASMDPATLPSPTPSAKRFAAEVIGGAVPYMAATTAGGLAVPYGAFLMGFSIMGEEAYDKAKATGATDAEADKERLIVGGICGALEAWGFGRLLKIGKGTSLKAIVHLARNKAWKELAKTGGKVTGNLVKHMAAEAIEESLQGTTEEVIPWMFRDIQPEGDFGDFLTRRAMEAAGGAFAGGLFGMGRIGLGGIKQATQMRQVDAFNAGEEVSGNLRKQFAKRDVEAPMEFGEGSVATEEDIKAAEEPIGQPGGAFKVYKLERSGEGDQLYIEFDNKAEAESYAETLTQSMATQGMFEVREEAGTKIYPEEKVDRDIIISTRATVETANEKLMRAATEIKKATKEDLRLMEKKRSQEKAKRIGEAREITEASGREELLYKGMKKLRGALEGRPVFKPISETTEFTQDEVESIRLDIRRSPRLRPFEKMNCELAFNKIFQQGVLPTNSEFKLLEKHFGSKFVENLRTAGISKKGFLWNLAMDVLNIHRAILASFDTSFGGRQGWLTLFSMPKQFAKSMAKSYQVFFSPNAQYVADKAWSDIQKSEYYDLSVKHDVPYTDPRSKIMSKREEFFKSSLAEKLPWGIGNIIKRSNLAYTTAANITRYNYFANKAAELEGTGATDKDYDRIATLTADITGRGELPKKAKQLAPLLNAVFFSPRLNMARARVGLDVFLTRPEGRFYNKALARELAAWIGTTLGTLGLLSLIKGITVEKDPRSADWGKVRYGDMRIDPWAGFSPMVRLMAQLITGERKVTDTGEIQGVDAEDVIWRFIQSKFAPPMQLAADIKKGETFTGERIDLTTPSVLRESARMTVPLVIQDLYDGLKYQGLIEGTIGGTLAFHGIGVQTYPMSDNKKLKMYKDELTYQIFGQKWDEVGPAAQKVIREFHPQIGLREEKIKAERTNYGFIDRMLQEQQKAGDGVFKTLPPFVQNEMKKAGVSVGGLGRRIGSDWFLNDARYQQYQDNVGKVLNSTLPKIVNNYRWKKLTDVQKNELLDYIIDECKKTVRSNLVDTANRKDLLSLKEMYGQE